MKRHNWNQHSEGTLTQVHFTVLISLLCVQLHTTVCKVSVVFCTVIFLYILYVYELFLMKSVHWRFTNIIHFIVYQWIHPDIFFSTVVSLVAGWKVVTMALFSHPGVTTYGESSRWQPSWCFQWLVGGIVMKYSKGCDVGCSIYGQMFFLGRL